MAISAQQLTIYLYSAHRAVIFAIAQLSCFILANADDKTTSVGLVQVLVTDVTLMKFAIILQNVGP